MALASYQDCKDFVLDAVGEAIDGTSDLDTNSATARHGSVAWRDLVTRTPWLALIKDPPGVFNAVASDGTTYTITIATAGTSVTGTLSGSPSASLAGYKIRPAGVNWIARVTAHTAATAALTLDAAPATIAAGTAVTIFKDEYALASDLGVFEDGLWSGDSFVPLWSQERLKYEYPDPPPAGSVPSAFARLTETKIRLSHYPTAAKRWEYPYAYLPSDPSGSSALAISTYLIPAFAALWAAYVYEHLKDARAKSKRDEAEFLIEKAIIYESRMRTGRGDRSRAVGRAPYQ